MSNVDALMEEIRDKLKAAGYRQLCSGPTDGPHLWISASSPRRRIFLVVVITDKIMQGDIDECANSAAQFDSEPWIVHRRFTPDRGAEYRWIDLLHDSI